MSIKMPRLFGCIIFIVLLKFAKASLDSLYVPLNGNCTGDVFTCRNGNCIAMNLRCNGADDCKDSSDEEDCDIHFCEEPHWFRCENKRCISRAFVCDGENDCIDFSDEKQCPTIKTSHGLSQACSKGEWKCTDSFCIPEEWVCNGAPDCPDKSDELVGCSRNSTCTGFKCNNGYCIPNEWRCDGSNDCHDRSDETGCEVATPPAYCTLEERLFLCGDKKTCINTNHLCDGKSHCPDNSDEGKLCNSSNCSLLNCSHDCIQMPTGPKCICPKGYHTVEDKLCTDVNECELYGICDQKCHNMAGTYQCYCDKNYVLQDDKKTCKPVGGEAILLFSSKSEIRGYYINSELYFSVAKGLKQVVGVTFDGHHVYWTDIFSENESIVKIKQDGSGRELLLTSGLGAPEDLAIDWVTSNIYFTDAELKHIGVCTSSALHCTVLVNDDVDKPRGIALNPAKGQMYWSDWGKRPEIARSNMDGSSAISFVAADIHWPNGIAIDYPNERLYWVDAKFLTLESINLDGTDRRVILEGIVQHPYAVAVFGNRLYWSDWATRSIESCNKFTGKDHKILLKEKRDHMYGIHIFHPAMKTRKDNPCAFSFCSDICLLNGMSYTCACPQDKTLNADKHTCQVTKKRETLIIGTKDLLIHVEHQILGKHNVVAYPTPIKDIGAMVYNTINNTLFISDIKTHSILIMDMDTLEVTPLFGSENIGHLQSMDFDHVGNNIYWCDTERSTVEVLSLHSMSKKVIIYDRNGDTPFSIALVPKEGIMFVAFQRLDEGAYIDRMNMDGTERIHVVEGLAGPVLILYDYTMNRIYWVDSTTGKIQSIKTDGKDKQEFRSLSTTPIGLVTLQNDIFWTNHKSRRLYWAYKQNINNKQNKKITLDIPAEVELTHLVALTVKPTMAHVCQRNNGNCSDICLISPNGARCACPLGMTLSAGNKTCEKEKHCESHEFFCHKSYICVSNDMRCNGQRDCVHGEDERDCDQKSCPVNYFRCGDGNCIKQKSVCDNRIDCKDKSDEENCAQRKYCPPGNFLCSDKKCILERFVCDGNKDCSDGMDEQNCTSTTCPANKFRCSSGACIPKYWECDHEYDCPDFSDEHSRCHTKICPVDKFSCNNGLCIDTALRCNKLDDCGDHSDENSCKYDTNKKTCEKNEFNCLSNSSLCIPESARCNGTSECPDHEDEKDCSQCQMDEFECANKRCIPTQWVCDRTNDCHDGSDESSELCSHKNDTQFVINISCDDGFQCKNGYCISKSLLCNGIQNCADGSDEDGACSTSCDFNNNPCQHNCIKTPTGPVCTCRSGYRLKNDGKTCTDIQECLQIPPVCSQICVEFTGSYSCQCYNEYVLRSDKKSCKAIGSSMSLIFSSVNEIRKLAPADNSLSVLHSLDSPRISGLDISLTTNSLYFSIEDIGTIYRVNLTTKTREYINNVGRPQKLAVDWITENVYYVNAESSMKTINVCHFDAEKCARIVNINEHNQVSSLVVDAINKYLFYTETNWHVFNSPGSVIYKSNLDGTNIKELVTSISGYFTGVTVDVNKHLLFYIDQHNRQINKIHYNGSKKIAVVANVTRPLGLNLFEDHLYFLMSNGYMGKCRLYGSQKCENIKMHTYSAEFFVIAQDSRQPLDTNTCLGHNCHHLCVPSNNSTSCLCELDQGIQQEANCDSNEIIIGQRPNFITTSSNGGNVSTVKSQSSGSVAAGILIPLFIVMVAVAVYYYIRKRKAGNFAVSIRFQNPIYGLMTDNQQPQSSAKPQEYRNIVDLYPCDMQAAADAIIHKVNPLVKVDEP